MIKKKLVLWIILISIVLIGSALRLYDLGVVPPSPDWDEVALGYNAYSILETGRDEYGKLLPVVLRSFDDYKPALYSYLIIPAIIFFDLTVFAVRFPSAVFGISSITAVFFLAKELFRGSKYGDYIAISTSFLFSISPWSIQFSRVAFESNIGLGLNILMVLFFLKGLKKPWFLSLSAIFAGLSIYTYQSEKVFVPLILLVLTLIYRKRLFGLQKKYIFSAVILGIFVLAPMIFYLFSNNEALLRAKGTSIFNYQTEILKTDTIKIERDRERNDLVGQIFDNRRVTYAKTIISGYIVHFDPVWLFITGDISRHHAPGMGLLYIFELPFILIGFYALIFGNFDRKTKLLIFSWFFLAAIPASVTTGVPHAVRTLNFLPTYQIFSALGIITVLVNISKFKFKYFLYGIFLIFFSFNFIYYLNQYFSQLNYFDSSEWQYGYKEAVDEVGKVENQYDKIIVSDNQPMDKSYMFFLFYLKYSPEEYQKIRKLSSSGYAEHRFFDKYSFRPIDWDEGEKSRNVLYVGNPEDFPDKISAQSTIENIRGEEVIKIVAK